MQKQAPQLGQAIVVLGYPLGPLMGNALSVSPGVISSLSGLGGDKSTFSVAANIQPGNSGGPVLDLNGDVIGVAVAKFNEEKLLQAAGTTGGGFGFVISASTLTEFLGSVSVPITAEPVSQGSSVQDAVARGKSFTYQVICRG